MVEVGADPENLCKKNGMKNGDQAGCPLSLHRSVIRPLRRAC